MNTILLSILQMNQYRDSSTNEQDISEGRLTPEDIQEFRKAHSPPTQEDTVDDESISEESDVASD